jgi:class 3 adenylate cyclase
MVALFERSALKPDGTRRRTAGKGVLSTMAEAPDGGSFEGQALSTTKSVEGASSRILGHGFSERGALSYILTVLEIPVGGESPILLRNSSDRFLGFVSREVAASGLGVGREVDSAVLANFTGSLVDPMVFTPAGVDCTLQDVAVVGLDIERFSTVPSEVQVFKYITLQVLLKQVLGDRGVRAFPIQTGDGYFLVLPNATCEQALRLCLDLQGRVAELSRRDLDRVSLRYALHSGPAYRLADINGQVNFIGDGMNYCARLLAVKEADVLIVSHSLYDSNKLDDWGITFEQTKLAIKHKSEPDDIYVAHLHR